jgi:trk system potassium uptake protein TrkH
MALFMCLLAATGLDFETAMILTISALTTTGPLAAVGGGNGDQLHGFE